MFQYARNATHAGNHQISSVWHLFRRVLTAHTNEKDSINDLLIAKFMGAI